MNKSKKLKLCFNTLYFITIFFSPILLNKSHADEKHILVLNSYHPDYEWTKDITSGIREAFKPINHPMQLHYEYMDTRRNRSDEYWSLMEKILHNKYRNKNFDIIISTDNNALDYLLGNRKIYGLTVPIVFSGVNNFKQDKIAGHKHITGVAEIPSISETLNLVRSLHPQVSEYVIIGTTKALSSRINLEMIQQVASDFEKNVNFTYYVDKRTNELKKFLQKMDLNQILILSGILYDRVGHPLNFKQRTQFIRKFCQAPIYSFWQHCLDEGIVGGKLVSAKKQGFMAGQLALKILEGQNPDDIAVIDEKANKWGFDYIELKRFNLDLSLIPDDSLIINKPPGLYEKYKNHILLFVVICFEFIIIILLISNITRRKRIESKLQKEKLFNERIINTSPAFFVLIDLKGNVINMNKSMLTMLGYSLDFVKGKNYLNTFIPKKEQEELKQVFERLATVQEIAIHVNKIIKHDGSTCTIEWYGTTIWDEKENLEAFLGIGVDITEKIALQKSLQQAQKMESIGNLAGGIAHDFNNILFPIIGISEMLIEDLSIGSHAKKSAEYILKAGKRGKDLVKQILAFSRHSEYKKLPTSVQHILKEVLMLSRSAIPSYIEIKQDIQKNCCMVMGNPTQIHQVVMNIITNAYHAIEPLHGVISVQLKETEFEASNHPEINLDTGKYVVLSISDTGHGMSDDLIHKIFDPYFTTKEKGKGTGLGLSVVYGIVKEHGGAIKVTSNVGKGSTFSIYLPLMKKSIDTENIETPEMPTKGKEKILLVDDDESIVKFEKQMLERLGYKVTSFINSVEAFNLFMSKPNEFDIVISDMNMPGLTGNELSKKIKDIRQDIPVIICTGFSERLSTQKADTLGINKILMKPLLKSELAKEIRKLLDEFQK